MKNPGFLCPLFYQFGRWRTSQATSCASQVGPTAQHESQHFRGRLEMDSSAECKAGRKRGEGSATGRGGMRLLSKKKQVHVSECYGGAVLISRRFRTWDRVNSFTYMTTIACFPVTYL